MTCLEYINSFFPSKNDTEDSAREWIIKSHADQRVMIKTMKEQIIMLVKEKNDLKARLEDIKYIRLPLSDDEKIDLIKFYHVSYYDTAQDTKDFAPEYFYLVEQITSGRVPVKLEFLTDYKDTLIEAFPQYSEQLQKIKEMGD